MKDAAHITALLDVRKPDVAEAVATIAPAVPAAIIDAIADHLASVAPLERPAAALSLAEALQCAAEACAPAIRHKAAGITAVALDKALKRFDGAAI